MCPNVVSLLLLLLTARRPGQSRPPSLQSRPRRPVPAQSRRLFCGRMPGDSRQSRPPSSLFVVPHPRQGRVLREKGNKF